MLHAFARSKKKRVALIKFELAGTVPAVNGNANRVLIANAEQLKVHSIAKTTGKLVCQINKASSIDACALNDRRWIANRENEQDC